jgi:hypothetical protein
MADRLRVTLFRSPDIPDRLLFLTFESGMAAANTRIACLSRPLVRFGKDPVELNGRIFFFRFEPCWGSP